MQTRRRFLLQLGSVPLIAACGRSAIAGGDAAAVCAPTGADIEGPFFKPDAPHRARLVESGAPGVPLSLSGSVVGPDCQPLRDVFLQVWQADHRGAYDNTGDRFRATLELHDGRFDLATIVPGRYLNGRQYRPAHIHVKVAARGHAPLTTQLYFPGDPHNAADPWFKPERMVTARKTKSGAVSATFQFALAR